MKFKLLILSSVLLGACVDNSIKVMTKKQANSYEPIAKITLAKKIKEITPELAKKGIGIYYSKSKGCYKYNSNSATFLGREHYSTLSVLCSYEFNVSYNNYKTTLDQTVRLSKLNPKTMKFKSSYAENSSTLMKLKDFSKTELAYLDNILKKKVSIGMPEKLLYRIRGHFPTKKQTTIKRGSQMTKYYYKKYGETIYVLNGKIDSVIR